MLNPTVPAIFNTLGRARALRPSLVLALTALCVQVFWSWKRMPSLHNLQLHGFVAPEHAAKVTPTMPLAADETNDQTAYPAYRLNVDDTVTPLPTLACSSAVANATCPHGLVSVSDVVLPLTVTHASSRRIPRVVHVTSRSRCVTPKVRRHLEQWRRTANHSFFFHDDEAVRRLLRQSWVNIAFRTGRGKNETSPGSATPPKARRGRETPFARREGCSWEQAYLPDRPPSEVALKCATSGATLADLWRYAVLFRYGGIYTDFDNSKGRHWRDDLVRDDDDFVGTVEKQGFIGQYWLASSPGHPYLRHTMDDALSHLRATPNVMDNVPERTTGPGAVKRGFCFFMEAGVGGRRSGGNLTRGTYVGDGNRSITVIGTHKWDTEYVHRAGLRRKTEDAYYRALNMTHFRHLDTLTPWLPNSFLVSCEQHLNRTAGQPEKKANYVYDAVLKRHVEAS